MQKKMPYVLGLFVFLSSLAMPVMVLAQTQTPPPPPPRQEGSAQVSFVGTTGNTSTSTFSAGGEHIVRPTDWLIKNTVLFINNRTEGVTSANSFLYAFRAERTLNSRTSAFGEYRYFQDELAGVTHRNDVTGGLAYKVATGPTHTLTVDGGIGYLNEQRVAGDDVSTATYSAGAAYKLQLSKNADLTDDFRFLGTFHDASDWRIGNILSVTAKINDIFALKFSNIVRYSNMPPIGFKTTDTTTSISLVASFKKQ